MVEKRGKSLKVYKNFEYINVFIVHENYHKSFKFSKEFKSLSFISDLLHAFENFKCDFLKTCFLDLPLSSPAWEIYYFLKKQ